MVKKSIDHIALQVDDIQESVKWYQEKYGCDILYEDKTWAFLQFENIKLALVVEDEHPYHIAFEIDTIKNPHPIAGLVKHRDGSWSKYLEDPSGNTIEAILYPKKSENN